MRSLTLMILTLVLFSAAACGGGGGGGDNGGGPGSAVSGYVPYLLSAPSLTFAVNASNTAKYDITVTVEADGPTGVQFADVWICDDTDANCEPIDLLNIPGTKRWRGTTNSFLPVPSGNYRVDDIMLHDGDPFTADPLRTGWYIYNDFLSTSVYFVDEREVSDVNILYYNWGLSAIPITRVTITS